MSEMESIVLALSLGAGTILFVIMICFIFLCRSGRTTSRPKSHKNSYSRTNGFYESRSADDEKMDDTNLMYGESETDFRHESPEGFCLGSPHNSSDQGTSVPSIIISEAPACMEVDDSDSDEQELPSVYGV